MFTKFPQNHPKKVKFFLQNRFKTYHRPRPGQLTEAGEEAVGETDLTGDQLAALSTQRLQ